MERERITISIKKKVLDSIDKTIDGVSIRNRSHAIETLVSKGLNLNDSKNAVILIGGKDAIKQIPIVEDNLKLLAKSDYQTVHIAVGFLASKVKDKLGKGDKFGLNLKFIEEGEGSGGVLLPLKKVFDKTFLVFNAANNIKGLNLEELFEFHRQQNIVATIATDDLTELNGIYVFEPQIFDFIPKDFSMLESDIFPKVVKEKQLVIYPLI